MPSLSSPSAFFCRRLWVGLVIACAVGAGVTSAAAQCCGADTDKAVPHEHHYALQGALVRLVPARGGVLIEHGAIAGLSRPMTNLFRLAPEQMPFVPAPGTPVEGALVLRDGEWWLVHLRAVDPQAEGTPQPSHQPGQ